MRPQYRYFLIACKTNASAINGACTDFKIDCPAFVSEDVWWTSMADTLYDSNYTSEEDVVHYFQTNVSAADYQPLDGRTVHALVNIYEEVNSTNKFGYVLKSYICLGRTKIDLTAPTVPVGPTRLACSESHCPRAPSLMTPAGFMQFSPSPTQLKLDLASVDDGDSLIEYTGVQVLRMQPTADHQADACKAIPLASAVGAGGNGSHPVQAPEPYTLADTDFNTFVDLGSGHEGWKETTPTPGRPGDMPDYPGGNPAAHTDARPEWLKPSTGGWFGASGWNGRLPAEAQGEQPIAACVAGGLLTKSQALHPLLICHLHWET